MSRSNSRSNLNQAYLSSKLLEYENSTNHLSLFHQRLNLSSAYVISIDLKDVDILQIYSVIKKKWRRHNQKYSIFNTYFKGQETDENARQIIRNSELERISGKIVIWAPLYFEELKKMSWIINLVESIH